MFHLEILIIVVAVIICGCNTLIIIRHRGYGGGGPSALLPAPDSRRRRQQLFQSPRDPPRKLRGRFPLSSPLLSAARCSFSTLPWEQQYHFLFERATADHHRFLGMGARSSAYGRAEEGTTESVNEGSGGSCVFLRRRTGSELGALARSRTATPSISILFFLFLSFHLFFIIPSPFHLSHFFEQIGWWRRNR